MHLLHVNIVLIFYAQFKMWSLSVYILTGDNDYHLFQGKNKLVCVLTSRIIFLANKFLTARTYFIITYMCNVYILVRSFRSLFHPPPPHPTVK